MNLIQVHLTKADFDAVAWHEVIDDCEKKQCSTYWEAFRTKASIANDNENKTSEAVYLLLAHACSLHLDSDDIENPLKPFMVFTDRRSAIIHDFSNDQLDVLAEIIPEIQDGELLARISDLVWLCKQDYKIAIFAVDGYIEASKTAENPMTSVQRLERGLKIASQLGKNGKPFANIKTYIDTLFDQKMVDKQYVIAWHLSDLLLLSKSGDEAKYIKEVKTIAEQVESDESWYFANMIWQSHARWYQLAGNEEDAKISNAKAAEVDVKQAEIASQQNNYLAATVFIQSAIEAYRRIGGEKAKARIEVLHKQLLDYEKQAVANMNLIEIPFEADINALINQAREDAQKKVAGLPFQDAILQFGIITNPSSKSRLRSEVEKSIKTNVFTHLIKVRHVDSEGKIRGYRQSTEPTANPEEQTIKAEMLTQAITKRSISVISSIQPALDQLREDHIGSMREFLYFVINHPFIPQGREFIFARGLAAGFREDYLLAAHLLIPQIENSLRYVLMRAGLITSGLDSDLIQQDYTLGKLLYMKELEEIFDENTIFDLQGLLVEPLGANLRNLTAHGLVQQNDFNNQEFLYLWWLVIRLCVLPILAFQEQSNQADTNLDQDKEI